METKKNQKIGLFKNILCYTKFDQRGCVENFYLALIHYRLIYGRPID